MNKVYLSLGSNMGERLLMLHTAQRFIENKIGNILLHSSVYETAAWGHTRQESFLNKVILIKTSLKPEELLKQMLGIEEYMGRTRGNLRWQERLIDIDILFYNLDTLYKDNLTIPHPEIQNRRFILIPLAEIAPDLVHPVLHKSVKELLKICSDDLPVSLFSESD